MATKKLLRSPQARPARPDVVEYENLPTYTEDDVIVGPDESLELLIKYMTRQIGEERRQERILDETTIMGDLLGVLRTQSLPAALRGVKAQPKMHYDSLRVTLTTSDGACYELSVSRLDNEDTPAQDDIRQQAITRLALGERAKRDFCY